MPREFELVLASERITIASRGGGREHLKIRSPSSAARPIICFAVGIKADSSSCRPQNDKFMDVSLACRVDALFFILLAHQAIDREFMVFMQVRNFDLRALFAQVSFVAIFVNDFSKAQIIESPFGLFCSGQSDVCVIKKSNRAGKVKCNSPPRNSMPPLLHSLIAIN